MVGVAGPTSTMRQRLRWVWIILLLCSYSLFTYNLFPGWWFSLMGTVLVLGFAYLAWPTAWAARTGVRIDRRVALVVPGLYLATAALGAVLVRCAASADGVAITPVWELDGFWSLVAYSAGQTFTEEIVLGALLLGAVSYRWQGTHRVVISVAVAAVFALFHVAFYGFRPEDMVNQGWLGPMTIVAVFAVGVLRNNLILGSGHVWFAWAVHFGWNTVFIHNAYEAGTRNLNEPEVFNLVLGYGTTAAAILATALMSTWIFRRALGAEPRDPR